MVDRKLIGKSISGNNAEENSIYLGIFSCGVRHVADVRKLVIFSQGRGALWRRLLLRGLKERDMVDSDGAIQRLMLMMGTRL